MNTDIASKYNVVIDLESHGGLLLTGSRIDRAQVQIQFVKHRVALGWLAFFYNFAVKLLHQQHGRPASQNVAS